MKNETQNTPHRIVIIGGGAGGLELATKLGDSLGKKRVAEVTLIDTKMTHLWKPLLHEVAAGTLNSYEDEISYVSQAYWHHFGFRLGRVDGIDRENQIVTTEPTLNSAGEEYIPRRHFPYDTLVIAVGSISNDFAIPGVREHCHYIDRQHQADLFRQHLIRAYYTAQTQQDALRAGQLHIAIAGGGATGVELAAELHHSVHQLVEYGMDRIVPEEHIKISIVESASRVLQKLPQRLSEQVQDNLRRVGIDVITGERISEATPDGFKTRSGRFIPAEIKVWAAGIKAPEFLTHIEGLERNSINQLLVRTTLQTTNDEDIFAFGDCAACPMHNSEGFVPPRAQAAHQQASMLVKAIKRRLKSEPLPEYRYVDYGSLINMSRYSTVGSLMGNVARIWASSMFVEGLFARFVYLSLYKMHQLALHGFLRVALITVANLLTHKMRARMKLH